MWRHAIIVRTDVSEEYIASIIRVKGIRKLVRFLEEPRGVTSKKTTFFIGTIVLWRQYIKISIKKSGYYPSSCLLFKTKRLLGCMQSCSPPLSAWQIPSCLILVPVLYAELFSISVSVTNTKLPYTRPCAVCRTVLHLCQRDKYQAALYSSLCCMQNCSPSLSTWQIPSCLILVPVHSHETMKRMHKNVGCWVAHSHPWSCVSQDGKLGVACSQHGTPTSLTGTEGRRNWHATMVLRFVLIVKLGKKKNNGMHKELFLLQVACCKPSSWT
jgi:hypothetical protein